MAARPPTLFGTRAATQLMRRVEILITPELIDDVFGAVLVPVNYLPARPTTVGKSEAVVILLPRVIAERHTAPTEQVTQLPPAMR